MTRVKARDRATTYSLVDAFNATGKLTAPWVNGSDVKPNYFEPIGARNGAACIWQDFQRGGGSYQADDWVHPPNPPGSYYSGIGCAYVDTGSTLVDITVTCHPNVPIPVTHGTANAHVETTPLLYVDLDNPLGGFGCWPSELVGSPAWLVGYMGSPPELFGQPSQPLLAVAAMTNPTVPFELRLVTPAPGRVLIYRDGVQVPFVRTTGPYRGPYDPFIIDPSLASSTKHGFELDGHVAYPDCTVVDAIPNLTLTAFAD